MWVLLFIVLILDQTPYLFYSIAQSKHCVKNPQNCVLAKTFYLLFIDVIYELFCLFDKCNHCKIWLKIHPQKLTIISTFSPGCWRLAPPDPSIFTPPFPPIAKLYLRHCLQQSKYSKYNARVVCFTTFLEHPSSTVFLIQGVYKKLNDFKQSKLFI